MTAALTDYLRQNSGITGSRSQFSYISTYLLFSIQFSLFHLFTHLAINSTPMYPTLARAPLPDFDFTDEEQREVYLPDEDSFLLMDTAKTFLEQNPDFRPRSVLEIGPGSGVVITSVLQTLKEQNRLPEKYGAFDQSALATEMTRRTLRKAGFEGNCV